MINNINYFKFITDIDPMKRVRQAATTLRAGLVERVSQVAIIIIERIDKIELIRKIYQYRVTPFIASGLLAVILAPTSLSACNAFLMGTAAVPALQGAKAIVEGKTLTEAIEDVAKRPSTSVLAGLYALRAGSQVGLDPYASFTAGAAAIPTAIAFNKAQNIKGILFKKIKDVFARIYQFLIDQLTKIKKTIQRTFSKDPKINKIVEINTTVQQTLLRNDEPISSREFA